MISKFQRVVQFSILILLAFSSMRAQAAPPLWSLAEFCEIAYTVNTNDFYTPKDYKKVLSLRDKKSGFQGASFLHKNGKDLIIAFAGTQVKDPKDVLADMGIVKGEVENRSKKILKFFELGNAQGLKKDEIKKTDKLEAQVKAATQFYKDSRAKAGQSSKPIIMGHSLGGFLAQVVGIDQKVTSHAFNGPGAQNYVNKNTSGKEKFKIQNHIRRHDLVGTFGKHIGELLKYRDTKFKLSIKERFLVRNHSIAEFKADLKDGMSPSDKDEQYYLDLVKELFGDLVKLSHVAVDAGGATGKAVINKVTYDMVLGDLRPGKKVAMWVVNDFRFSSITKELDVFPLDKITIPKALLVFSIAKTNDLEVEKLPKTLRDFSLNVLKQGDRVPPLNKGLNLVGQLEQKRQPKELRDVLGFLGANKTDILLGGGIGNFVKKPPIRPEVDLYAQLPGLKFSDKMPDFLKPSGKVEPRLRLKAGKKKTGVFASLGLLTDLDVTISGKTLTMGGNLTAVADKLGLGLHIAAKKDTWNDALGIKRLNLEMLVLKTAVLSDGSAKFGLQGALKTKSGRHQLTAAAAVNPATGINPKELIFKLETNEIGMESLMEVTDIFMGQGDNIIAQKARKPGLYKAMQLDKMPDTRFKGLKKGEPLLVYFSGPSASDPDLDVSGMGAKLKAILEVAGHDIALADVDLGLKGLNILGDVLIKKIGPLKLEKARLDGKATWDELPYLAINTDVNLLGVKKSLDLEIGSKGFLFRTVDRLGDLFGMTYEARTLKGFKPSKDNDFIMAGSLDSDFGEWLQTAVGKEAVSVLNKADSAYAQAQKKLKQAESTLKRLKSDLKKARKVASKDIKKAKSKIRKASKKVNKLKGKYKKYKRKYRRAKWYNPKRGWYWAKHKVYKASYKIAKAVLRTLVRALDKMPLEMHPKVIAAGAKYGGALAGYKTAEGALIAIRAANKGVTYAIQKCVDGIADADILVVKDASFKGSLAGITKGAPATFNLDLLLATQQVGFRNWRLDFKKPIESIDVKAIAGKFVDALRGRDKKAKKKKKKKYTRGQAKTVVTKLYRELLLREPDGGGLKSYADQLVKGKKSANDIKQALKGSTEYKEKHSKKKLSRNQAERVVKDFYLRLLLRKPTGKWLKHYSDSLQKGKKSQAQVYKELSKTKEHKNKFTKKKLSKSKAEKTVKEYYQRLLLREPDFKGHKYHSEKLKKGKISRGSLHTALMSSKEYKNKHTRRKVSRKEAERDVKSFYRHLLKRAPDGGGLEHHVGNLMKGNKSYAETYRAFTGSKEYKKLKKKEAEKQKKKAEERKKKEQERKKKRK